MKKNLPNDPFSSTIILEIYELMKEIGANFKFSDEELKSKIINF